MMLKLKFSIIVPIFNREQIIDDVVQSALDQNYSNWELLLIDDGSTDKTCQICQEYAEKDVRIHYMYKENSGVSSARNSGIQTATGDYIVFVDSDNTMTSNMLSVLSEAILGDNNPDIVVFGFYSSPSTKWLPAKEGDIVVVNRERIFNSYLPTHLNIYKQDENFLHNYVWNKTFSRHFLIKNNLTFDENRKTWEDGIFVINCLQCANKILLIPKAIYNAYTPYQVDHLSSKVFLDQLLQYICDETHFMKAFEKYFSFEGEHYCTSNINVMKQLLTKTINTYGKDANETIKQALAMPIVKQWAANANVLEKNDKKLFNLLIKGNSEAVIKMYQQNVINKTIRKAKKMIKKKWII